MRQETIGTRIGTARRHIGKSIDAFSDETGIPKSTLKKYESGSSTPGGEAIQSIAKIGINANWLLTGEGPILIKDLTPPLHPEAAPEGPIDRGVVRDVVEVVEEVFRERRMAPLAPDKKAELILLLCDEIMEQEEREEPNKQKINRLLKLIG